MNPGTTMNGTSVTLAPRPAVMRRVARGRLVDLSLLFFLEAWIVGGDALCEHVAPMSGSAMISRAGPERRVGGTLRIIERVPPRARSAAPL
jgi:hypothetical protein